MTKYTVENTTALGLKATVFLEGVELDRVIKADDDLGYAIVVKVDAGDQIIVESEEVATERREGSVRVELEQMS